MHSVDVQITLIILIILCAFLYTGYQPTLKMYGRSFLQSREIIAYGDNKAADDIAYSGTKVPLMKTHPEILLEIQAFVEQKLNTKFNHCMLNHYKDGSVHIGAHSDNLGELCLLDCATSFQAMI